MIGEDKSKKNYLPTVSEPIKCIGAVLLSVLGLLTYYLLNIEIVEHSLVFCCIRVPLYISHRFSSVSIEDV